ncbi:MAG TPA: sulfurtransferase complex subunit TusB [Buchnera sp. (in: enterobacteria)]|nr:sulfurtransferase complex subunit TusB [Buchnera sp. (in: enterobacteria)]
MLHTLIHSPFKSNMILLLNMLNKNDDFLALQDGVFIALKNNFFLKKILKSSARLYLLKEDVYARGIYENISIEFILIDYNEFVFLTEKNKKQMNW